jgi:hypothetical protein
MMQGDAEVVPRRARAVRLNKDVKVLVRGDRTVEQKVVLAVDAAACGGEDLLRHQLHDCGELCAIHLGGHQAGGNQPAVPELLAGVKSRLGEVPNQLRAEDELEGSNSVSGAQGDPGHGSLKQTAARPDVSDCPSIRARTEQQLEDLVRRVAHPQ